MNLSTLASPSPGPRTLGEILRRQAADHPGTEFLVFPDNRWTYADFDAWVDRLACGLTARGIGRGSKVAIMLPNCPEFVGLWFACARIGAVEVPVNVNLRGQLLGHVLRQSEAAMVVAGQANMDDIGAALADMPGLATVISVGEGAFPSAFDTLSTANFTELENVEGAPPEVALSPDDPAAIIFTSGTTGPSKGAVLSHTYFWWFGERCCQLRGMAQDECLYTCLPLFHANAQALTVMPALLRGRTAVLDTQFTASGFWDRLRDFGATQFNYIGGMIPILMKQPPSAGDRDHRVRLAMGAAAPHTQWQAFEDRFGLRIMECYGQTEDCAVTANPVDDVRIGSIGKPLWGYEMQVVDDDGRVLPDGETGEFVVRPQEPGILMKGYYGMPEETLSVFENLWFHTGDFGWRDADGYFYFVDRKKDALRRRGENISAWEVELAINEHPAILESAVYAVPSDVGEDEVMVAAILRDGQNLTEADLIEHCQTRLAYFAVPRFVSFRADLPRTPTHRIEKYKLRREGVTPDTWDREAAGIVLRR